MFAVRKGWCGKVLASLLLMPFVASGPAFAGGNVLVSGTKTVSGTFAPGGTVTYTITGTNSGTYGQQDNVGNEFTDTLPAGLTLVSANATSGTAATAGNTVTWNGALAPLGGSVTITITATIDSGATGSISNQGTFSYDFENNGSNESTAMTDDPSVGGTTDPTVFSVLTADVAGTKTVSGTFAANGTVTYLVTLANSGSAAQSDNPGNEFVDVLPASLTLVSANATSGTATANTGTNTVTWNGAIPAGGSSSITITATVNPLAVGTVSNQGTINYDVGGDGTNESMRVTDDPSVGGASDATVFAIVPSPDLAATKTVAGTFAAGGTVTYTITIANNGGGNQTDNAGDEFVDVLPASLTLVSASSTSGTAVANVGTNTVTWNGTIPSKASVTITITATVNPLAVGTVSNQGTVNTDADGNGTNEATRPTDDPGVAGASNPTTFAIAPAPDLSATKTVAGTFAAGGTVTYTITIANNGGGNQTDNAGDEFVDVLPASLTLVSATANSGTAVATVGTNTVTWNGTIPSKASVTITITATVNPLAVGTVSNQGTVNTDADGNGTNEATRPTDDPGVAGASNPTTFAIAPAPDLAATKTVTGTFAAGGTVTYTITIANNGGGNQTDNAGDEFFDVLPASLTLVSASSTSGTAVANVGTNTVMWNGTIPSKASVTITITATVNPLAVGTVSNQGTVNTDADGNGTNEATRPTDDPGVAGASNPTTFAIAPAPNLAATKTVAGTFAPGGTVTYTIVIANNGGGTQADNAGDEFTDVLPSSLTLVSATANSGTAVANVGTNTVTWNGAIPSKASVTITITVTIDAGTSGTVSNQGTVSTDADGNGTNEATRPTDDPSVGGATDPTVFTIAPTANVTGTKIVAGTFVRGGAITYTIVLTNGGTGAQGDNPGDEFTDVLPAGLTLVSATATSGTAVANLGTDTVTWNGTIAAGGSVTITIDATIDDDASGTISNQGSIAYDGDANGTNESTAMTQDPVGSGATAFNLVSGPNVGGTKTVSGTFAPGGAITYTIVLSNGGATTQADNPGNEFSDVLPAGLVLVSATATSGTATATVGTRTVTWNGSITAGTSVTITIAATIDPTAVGTLVNQGTIAYDADSNGTNEATALTDDPAVPGTTNGTAFSIAVPAVLVPATDALALLMLAMLVLVAARRMRSS